MVWPKKKVPYLKLCDQLCVSTNQPAESHSKSQKDGEQLTTGQKGGHPVSRDMFWEGVAAFYRLPSFNQLFISKPWGNEHIQPYRNVCVCV